MNVLNDALTVNKSFIKIFFPLNITYYLVLRYLIKFDRREIIKLISNIISILHTSIVVSGSYQHVYGTIEDRYYYKYLLVSRSYLICDIIYTAIFYKKFIKEFKSNLIHHALLYSATLCSGHYHLVSQGLIGEITNIPLYGGWLLLKINKQNTWYFKANALTLLITYFIFRICNFSNILYKSVIKFDVIPSVITSGILYMNVNWFKLLLRKFFKL